MKKYTKHSVQWLYSLLERGECDFIDFKEQIGDKTLFGKSQKNFSASYDDLARDVVAFANRKGGFICIGVVDQTKELNPTFTVTDEQTFQLIRQIQDRTQPTITLIRHLMKVDGGEVLVLEVPFSQQLHRTSKGEYLIRNVDGNRAIEPQEMATVMSEKGLIVYDQKTWDLRLAPGQKDKQGVPVPGWQDVEKSRKLYTLIQSKKPSSPYLKSSALEFNETLGLIREENNQYLPTTTGLLFIGNAKALRQLPYNQIKYIRYREDGTYTPFEYSGDLISMADACFSQLKSEINFKELGFPLFGGGIEKVKRP